MPPNPTKRTPNRAAPGQTPAGEVREALGQLKGFFRQAMGYSLVVNALALTPVFYMLQAYGRVVDSRSTSTLVVLTMLVLFLYAVMELSDWVRGKLLHAAGERLDQQLGQRVFNATFGAQLRGLPVGVQPLADLKAIRSFLGGPTLTALADTPMALLYILIIFVMNPLIGAFVSVAALAMLGIGYYTERQTSPPLTAAQRSGQEAQRYATTSLQNAQVIAAMGMWGDIRRRWLQRQNTLLAQQAEASDHAGTGAALSKFVLLAQGSLVLGMAAWLTIIGEMAAGGAAMILVWILSSRALQPLQMVISQWKSVVQVRDNYNRLQTFLAQSPEREAGMALPAPKGALQVEALVAAAPGSQAAILRGVNFALNPGEALAVVGPSASGKSTLARLLVGLWPAAAGRVRLDGVDVYAWNKEELGPHIGYLPQDTELFDGTLAENIARFGDADPHEVRRAATAVGLDELVAALPDGFDTLIGPGGVVLSGGQRQRVALARAIYRDPAFIVLDEPNSSLDEAGERALVQTLLGLKARGATLVVMTHRTSVLAAIDKMLILRDGQVQAFGPRDEVLAALQGRQPAVPQKPGAAPAAGAPAANTPPPAVSPPDTAAGTRPDTPPGTAPEGGAA